MVEYSRKRNQRSRRILVEALIHQDLHQACGQGRAWTQPHLLATSLEFDNVVRRRFSLTRRGDPGIAGLGAQTW